MPLTSAEALEFLNARLTKVDPEVIKPLAKFTYSRDLPLNSNLDRTVEALVLNRLVNGAQGTTDIGGRSWIGNNANDLKGVSFDVSAKAVRVMTGGREASWSDMQIERARASTGVNFDTEQISVINSLYQKEANAVAYLGDELHGIKGLLNSEEATTIAGGGLIDSSSTKVATLVSALNDYIRQAEQNANDVVTPDTLLVSPAQYAKLFSIQLPDATATSMVEYLARRSLGYAKVGHFNIYAVPELAGIGKNGKDRAVLYTKDAEYVRFSVLPVWREKTYDKGLQYCAAYLWRIAEVEFRHPETVTYIDNL